MQDFLHALVFCFQSPYHLLLPTFIQVLNSSKSCIITEQCSCSENDNLGNSSYFQEEILHRDNALHCMNFNLYVRHTSLYTCHARILSFQLLVFFYRLFMDNHSSHTLWVLSRDEWQNALSKETLQMWKKSPWTALSHSSSSLLRRVRQIWKKFVVSSWLVIKI